MQFHQCSEGIDGIEHILIAYRACCFVLAFDNDAGYADAFEMPLYENIDLLPTKWHVGLNVIPQYRIQACDISFEFGWTSDPAF
ncbi:hypothetical protein BJF92_15705 [Rhizobium rhizosphaerae]|uniref:Uncharacterized protein n=1 Tax=Xaviernesmea rhizosphaerae TaxID=1672749 RepID=A0A1Q9AM39_9HYPH|nr:hypothetical protein BJF92_15705 [Xaviernesmea rhizosphaerae]